MRPLETLTRGLGDHGQYPNTLKSDSVTEVNVQTDNHDQPELCDGRLRQLNIGHWTRQPISNELAARAISCYLTLSHPFFSFFDAQLFLDDLISNRLRYCSSFLVNSLMAYACQAYAIYDSRTAYFSALFISEAAALWRVERSTDNIVNISAMVLLSLACSLEATEVSVLELMDDARQMAVRMQLFHHTNKDMADFAAIENTNPEHMTAMAYTAWGAYNWLTYNTFYRSVRPIEAPPMLPIPGDDTNALQSDYTYKTFPALCRIWMVMQEVAGVYYESRLGASVLTKISVAFAESKYRKLMETFGSYIATANLLPRDNTQIILCHMIYHCAVEDILHPFIHGTNSRAMAASPSERKSIQNVLWGTSNQLKSLLLAYRLQTPRSQYFIMVANAFIHIGNDLVREGAGYASNPAASLKEWKFWFMLCLASWQDLICKFPVAEAASKSLLTMAMRNNLFNIQDALDLRNALDRPKELLYGTGGNMQDFTIDFDLAVTQPEEAKLNSIAKKFSDLALFHEMTEGGDFTVNE
ncbi:hypothetical protein NQ176_g386 [Zarea fungicola]|uniref:Uncharacterized protein n=1 Tax=Zarea fungicola TaxID=93591 RepID=A0ACC1NWY2_9HYPO|nr:hypothetical protein NQ176_g386 [Lecanicillium fungicola]